ncbi:uncharacterized protein LOC124656911 [Lolium rigidum]|uniref:uncharacterized protein LOC124656911 n=1 Tax=Lolium rigidum TaxID=89674 RepID=UPI001F5DFB0C|nr:uncharacterized protein LOC124656911 [Lolium rigidum]
MAEQPGDKSGDASIEKMYEIFSKLLEQQQMKAVPETVKYALEPNPVRLSGPGTYVSWARHAQLILSSHGYENLLVDDEDKKENCDTRTKQTNDKVLVWLLGSMKPSIRGQVETMETVHEVWSSLHKQVRRRDKKKLYRDLHYYHPFEPVDKKDIAIHHTWFESFVSKLFLDGLNDELNLRRQLIFSEPEWPSLDDIISSVIEEETRLSQPKEDGLNSVDARAALSMQARYASKSFGKADKRKFFCEHCRKNGHKRDTCFELHGYPPWWEKGRSQSGGAQGSNRSQANHTTATRELPLVDIRALDNFTSKLKLSEGSSSSQDSSKADSSVYVTSHQGAKDRENFRDWDRA